MQEEALMACAAKRQAEAIGTKTAELGRLKEAAAKAEAAAEAAAEAELARRIASHQAAGPSW